MKNNWIFALVLLVFSCVVNINAQSAKDTEDLKYKLLATIKTSTMQKEIDQVSAQGYRILVGSPTSDAEMAVFLSRDGTVAVPYKYILLATTRTSTMH
jgi:hypothetical protein